MKKLVMLFMVVSLIGCHKDDFLPEPQAPIIPQLQIKNAVGIKLESSFVTSEVAMNVKMDSDATVTIKIFDIANRVVSKETMSVKSGDNILKVYTSALPSSAYRIGIFDVNDKMLGITDFNKL